MILLVFYLVNRATSRNTPSVLNGTFTLFLIMLYVCNTKVTNKKWN